MSDLRGLGKSQIIRRDMTGHTPLCETLGILVAVQTALIRLVIDSHGFDNDIREELARSVQRLAWAHAHAHTEGCQP